MSGSTERWYPFLGGLLFAASYLTLSYYVKTEDPKELLTSAISVSGTMVGFLVTAKTILLALDKEKRVVQLKQMGKFNTLIEYLMTAVSLSLLTALLSAITVFFSGHRLEEWFRYLFASWTALAVWTALSCYRAITILSFLLKS